MGTGFSLEELVITSGVCLVTYPFVSCVWVILGPATALRKNASVSLERVRFDELRCRGHRRESIRRQDARTRDESGTGMSYTPLIQTDRSRGRRHARGRQPRSRSS
jgi:hypothetical protein